MGQSSVNEVKRRFARFDELGHGRQSKMSTLSQLLIRSHAWPNPDPDAPPEEEWLGLCPPVTALGKPVLMTQAPWDKRGGEPHLIKVRIVVGSGADALRAKAAAAARAAAANDDDDSDAEMVAEVKAEVVAERGGGVAPTPEVKPEPEAPLPLAPVASLAPAPAAEDDSPVSDADIPETFGLNEEEKDIWEDAV